MRKLQTVIIIALALFVLVPPTTAQQSEQPEKYLLLSTSRTGTMEDELNEAGRAATASSQPKGARPPSAAAKPSSS